REAWERGLDLARTTRQVQPEATFLSNLSTLAGTQERYDEAISYIVQGVTLHRQQKNTKGLAYALLNYADILYLRQDYAGSLVKLRESCDLFDDIGDRYGEAWTVL